MKEPKICPYCNGDVVRTSNSEIYGKEYGNGVCYLCRSCRASVGTHDDGRPLGILATKEMKNLKKKCHEIFDPIWKNNLVSRTSLYKRLAIKLSIPFEDCHFGHFDTTTLNKVLRIMSEDKWWKDDISISDEFSERYYTHKSNRDGHTYSVIKDRYSERRTSCSNNMLKGVLNALQEVYENKKISLTKFSYPIDSKIRALFIDDKVFNFVKKNIKPFVPKNKYMKTREHSLLVSEVTFQVSLQMCLKHKNDVLSVYKTLYKDQLSKDDIYSINFRISHFGNINYEGEII